ncbi:response regulator transcription factor [Vibrio algarum]|uniref:LuxR C-terminal-related transcriptional regulator n=1 Tax=Vibrio algarum TaxID=3020714 RepID=A0ABT4YQQ2_9VIBR|nr:LuxR C-terminal-related transcriptional regulator [Vibrio sp. KJ40-1]MDB1123805.1 LuxR C-terminal-related transcriptional regulator [Vibrio sp. KJ40-1]
MDYQRLNKWIIELYQHSANVPLNDFKHWALTRLQDWIEFDSALWVSCSNLNVSVNPVDVYLFNQPYAFMKSYQALYPNENEDPIVKAILASPDNPIRVKKLFSNHGYYQNDIYLKHGQYFGIEDVISTLKISESTGTMNIVSLYNSATRYEFSEQDTFIKHLLMPHLVEALRNNLISSINAPKRQNRTCAILDNFGFIYEAEELFISVLKKVDYIKNNQLRIPNQLESLNSGVFEVDKETLLKLERVDGLLFASLNTDSPLRNLTLRQTDIVQALCEGSSDNEIAKKFNLSPKTIRNHLSQIYKKTGLNNRASLINYYLINELEHSKEPLMEKSLDPKVGFKNVDQDNRHLIEYLDVLSEHPNVVSWKKEVSIY